MIKTREIKIGGAANLQEGKERDGEMERKRQQSGS